MVRIGAIWAENTDRGIGLDNKMAWHVPGELAGFKRSTRGTAILMGRKTFESMDFKPLPGRLNIVLTRRPQDWKFNDVYFVNDIDAAIDLAESKGYPFMSIIGGADLLMQALPYLDMARVTTLKPGAYTGPCDRHIPEDVHIFLERYSYASEIVEDSMTYSVRQYYIDTSGETPPNGPRYDFGCSVIY
jgi:dihydrofolate reductase